MLADTAVIYMAGGDIFLVTGARFLFHLAVDYRLWTRDLEGLLRVNVEGARIVRQEALRAGVERVVHTSSVGALAPKRFGLSNESRRLPLEKAIGAYKRSKILSERLVDAMVESERLPAVVVNQSAPLGRGDPRPTPKGRIIFEAMQGRIPAFVNAGLNIAHVDDVASGHLAALERGRIGEHYLLGGDNVRLVTIHEEVVHLSSRTPPRFGLPRPPLVPIAFVNEMLATFSGKEPFLSRESLRCPRRRCISTAPRRGANWDISRVHIRRRSPMRCAGFATRKLLRAANTHALAVTIECVRVAMRSLRCVALVLAGLYSYPAAAEPSPGFTYCVAPFPPDCVKAPVRSDSHDECETRVQAYVASVFRFRECVEAESEREVRRANEVLDQWRCKGSRKECQH